MVYGAITASCTASTHLAIQQGNTILSLLLPWIHLTPSGNEKILSQKLTEFGAYVVVSVLSILIPLVKSDDNVGF